MEIIITTASVHRVSDVLGAPESLAGWFATWFAARVGPASRRYPHPADRCSLAACLANPACPLPSRWHMT